MLLEKLNRKQRFRSGADFRRPRSFGKKFNSTIFLCRIMPSAKKNKANLTRVGLIVSKRIGTAPARNYVKRVFRELFRRNQDHLPRGSDLLFIAHPKITEASFSQIHEQFKMMIKYFSKINF